MNQIERKIDRLEKDGERMVELSRMTDARLRGYLCDLLSKAQSLCEKSAHLEFTHLAAELAAYRTDIGLVMRECEIRGLG